MQSVCCLQRLTFPAPCRGQPDSSPGQGRRGLALSRKGIQITVDGSNPDGPGTVLRLWEQAGQSGKVSVRLPERMNVKQVQPVDLRGRPVGQPIPVKNGSFKVRVGAFAPVSLVLNVGE